MFCKATSQGISWNDMTSGWVRYSKMRMPGVAIIVSIIVLPKMRKKHGFYVFPLIFPIYFPMFSLFICPNAMHPAWLGRAHSPHIDMITQEEAPAAAEGGSFAGRKFGEFMGHVGVFSRFLELFAGKIHEESWRYVRGFDVSFLSHGMDHEHDLWSCWWFTYLQTIIQG